VSHMVLVAEAFVVRSVCLKIAASPCAPRLATKHPWFG